MRESSHVYVDTGLMVWVFMQLSALTRVKCQDFLSGYSYLGLSSRRRIRRDEGAYRQTLLALRAAVVADPARMGPLAHDTSLGLLHAPLARVGCRRDILFLRKLSLRLAASVRGRLPRPRGVVGSAGGSCRAISAAAAAPGGAGGTRCRSSSTESNDENDGGEPAAAISASKAAICSGVWRFGLVWVPSPALIADDNIILCSCPRLSKTVDCSLM